MKYKKKVKKKDKSKLTYSEVYVCHSPVQARQKMIELELKGYDSSEIYNRIVYGKFGDWHRIVGVIAPEGGAI